MTTKNQISRREFLRAAGLLAAGTVTGTGFAKKSSTKKIKKEADKNILDIDKIDETTRLFRFVQVSDTQPKEEDHWQRTSDSLDIINKLNPAFVIMPGDMTWNATESQCKRMKRLFSKIKAPLYMVPGNHDTTLTEVNDPFADSKSPEEFHRRKMEVYNKFFGNDRWAFEYDDFQFVGFDGTKSWPKLLPETKRWLKKTFNNSNKPYKFVVVHFINDQPYNWDESYFKSTQTYNTDLDKIMSEVGAIGYLHGHNHFIQAYRDANSGRLVFSSASTTFNDKYGVMYFDVYKDSMTCFWQPVNGEVISLGVFDLRRAKTDYGRKVFPSVPAVSEIKPTEVVVKWQTDFPLNSSLKFREKNGELWINQIVKTNTVSQKMKISDLEPNTEYQFYINADPCDYAKVRSDIIDFKTSS